MRKFASLLAVLMLFSALAFGQDRTITGTVTDESGAVVPGASVRIKGTNTGVAADNSGQFRIRAKAGDVILVTGAGIDPSEMTVGSDNTVNISVKKSIVTGAEVVVTALGIRRTEKALGYAVSKVDPNVLLQKSEPDFLKGLQGKVPGVDIRTTNGAPGASTRIQIRGVSSLSLETQPLVVVDGVPYSNSRLETGGVSATGNSLANLDPNDIESFNILKGAAAASLYGSRASRGVLVITTKSGSGRKGAKSLNVSLKSGASIERIGNLPDLQNSFGNGAQQNPGYGSNGSWGARFGLGNVYNAAGARIRASASGVDSIPASVSTTPTASTYGFAYPELFNLVMEPGPGGTFIPTLYSQYKAYPNNVRDMFNTGKLFENSININGGEGNTSFSMTASNVNHLGYVENSGYVRNNISVGGQTRHKNLTLGGNVSFARSKQKSGVLGGGSAFNQYGRYLIQGRAWNIAGLPSQDKAGKPVSYLPGQYISPYWAAYHNVITTWEERTVANVRASYKFSNAFSLNYTFGVNTSNIFRDEIFDEYTEGLPLGLIQEDNFRQQELQSTLVAVFTPKIGKDFSLDFKLGNDFNHSATRRQAQSGTDLIVPGLFSIENTNTKVFSADDRSKRRLVGFFADATFGFRNFAFLNVTGRQDRTSTLPYESASYFYPGVSGSLIWTDAFKLKSNWLDYGKVRAGYAKVGNDANPQRGQDLFNLSTSSFLNQPFGSRSNITNDPDLTPEFTKELEIGTDLSLFKRRVNLDFTWYDKSSTNLIYDIDVPVTTGYTRFFTNIGEITNKGIEIGLNLRPIVTKDFSWDVRTSFTKNKNMVERLVEGLVRTNLASLAFIEAGFPFGYLRGSKGSRTADGELLIDPSTGWPLETPELGMIGDPNPDWKLGISNNLSYKGFSLNVLWDMTKGGDFFSNTIMFLLGRGVTRDTEGGREMSQVITGVYADPASIGTTLHKPLLIGGKTVPNQTRVTYNDLFFASGAPNSSTFAINGHDEYTVFDGTVYRLREVTLGYDLPKKIVSKLKLSAISVLLSGRNLWYNAPNLPKYTNFDPEANSTGNGSVQGIESFSIPTTKRFGINLNVTF